MTSLGFLSLVMFFSSGIDFVKYVISVSSFLPTTNAIFYYDQSHNECAHTETTFATTEIYSYKSLENACAEYRVTGFIFPMNSKFLQSFFSKKRFFGKNKILLEAKIYILITKKLDF